ncbi:uroporphyrinogen-III C-methyltransferase [Prosthecodimorpha staleyi]|uniref:uroporphyrinogen-III C-methyltransferase n=1 Tax=Prosthecodimorpha staleyi TaxID=2840188 RepID=A0A947D6U8_9HYPH|nr:uroporphyrinogen-III C-methyltransferase [Prosthecodimorpha staleyi]MBT9291805.1 uroporphyrinogen-III C-methyltransferase [Prosthecodimorpha staleyi]
MTDLDALVPNLPVFEPGTVWLVGAGPGDPGLFTLAGLHAMRQADVIVHDALVGDGVMALAPAGTERDYAGKRGGRPSHSQADITERLIAHARAGKRVLRLKGGDPFVFGRGGEETLALAAAGIRFHIVPGITSGLAGLAAASIPATTRGTNHAVILMTGHPAAGAEGPAASHADWPAFAATGAPLILYMAMTHLDAIARRLLEGGMAPDTAVAVVTDATTPRQRVLVTRLETCAADAAAAALKAPAIVAIGSIVGLRATLAPFAIGPGAPEPENGA